MAILDLLGVELRAGGKTLPEYDGIDQQENPPPRMTTKYVRVPAGRIFQIRVSVSEHYQFNSEGLEFQILIDGRIHEILLILKEQHPGGSADVAGVEIQGSDGVVKLRPLRFSNINFGLDYNLQLLCSTIHFFF